MCLPQLVSSADTLWPGSPPPFQKQSSVQARLPIHHHTGEFHWQAMPAEPLSTPILSDCRQLAAGPLFCNAHKSSQIPKLWWESFHRQERFHTVCTRASDSAISTQSCYWQVWDMLSEGKNVTGAGRQSIVTLWKSKDLEVFQASSDFPWPKANIVENRGWGTGFV